MLMNAASVYKEFDETQKIPSDVDFRRLTSGVAFGARATHLIHTYPAKLLPYI